MTERDAERHFVQTRPLNLARYTKQLRSRRFFCADFAVLVDSKCGDERDIAERLNVVDHCGFAEQTGRGGKGWFDARQAALAFDRFQERGFLAANIGAGAKAHFYREVESRAENVCAQE